MKASWKILAGIALFAGVAFIGWAAMPQDRLDRLAASYRRATGDAGQMCADRAAPLFADRDSMVLQASKSEPFGWRTSLDKMPVTKEAAAGVVVVKIIVKSKNRFGAYGDDLVTCVFNAGAKTQAAEDVANLAAYIVRTEDAEKCRALRVPLKSAMCTEMVGIHFGPMMRVYGDE